MLSIRKFLWFCAGVDQHLLAKASIDQEKYLGQGLVVLLTGVLAVFSGSYALYTIFHQVVPAIGLGLVWGLVIFNLDRYLLASMRKTGNRSGFWQLIPRLGLALVLAVVIARPLEWKIFESEISTEYGVMVEEARRRSAEVVAQRYQQQVVPLEARQTQLQQQLQQATTMTENLEKEARVEADGTGGSRIRNMGPIYKLKAETARQARQRLDTLEKKTILEMLQVKSRLKALEAERDSVTRAQPVTVLPGPAGNEEALARLSATHPSIAIARWFVFLLFVVLEMLPVLVKWITPAGPYDYLLQEAEHQISSSAIASIATTSSNLRQQEARLAEPERDFLVRKLTQFLQ